PDPLTRVEGADAAATQRGDVDEHVLAAAVGRDEPVALFRLEPFDGTLDRRGGARPAVGSTCSAWRCERRAVVDVQHVGHQRTLCSGADLAGDRRPFANILIAGAAQDGHRQKRILRSIVRRDESKTLAGVEPFDFGVDAATWERVLAKEALAAFGQGSSKRAIERGERVERRIIAQTRRIALALTRAPAPCIPAEPTAPEETRRPYPENVTSR